MWWILKLTFPFLLLKISHLTDVAGEMLPSLCPSGWKEYEHHCYGFLQKDANWSAAEVDCRSFGGNLVKIDDVRENEWITNQTKGLQMNSPSIGLYKYDGDWRWVVDFQVPSFCGWLQSLQQPSGDGNCTQLSKAIQYGWNDIPCNEKFDYICESEKLPSQYPSEWKEYEDHCYGFIQKQNTWFDAEVDCRSFGGTLVKIDDVKENEWITNQTKELSMNNTWIGLYKYNDNWRWVIDFHMPLFLEWSKSSNEPSGDGNCVHLLAKLNFKWNDEPCTKAYNYICERNCSECKEKFGSFSVTCGTGKQPFCRRCNNPVPGNGEVYCNWDTVKYKGYTCGWSNWETFGSCSVTCGTGKRLFFRLCNNPVQGNSELYCQGDTVKYEDCNLGACPGMWGCWRTVGYCSATCGNGSQLMVRECDNPAPTDGGPNCKGENVSSVWCNIRDCPVYKWEFLKEMNLTKSEMVDAMKKELNELQANLTVDTKNTSAAIRHRTSARDERPSAASVGYVAIVLLSIPFIMMICCDCTRLFQTTGKKRTSKIAAEQNIQDNENDAGHGNGSRPVQCQM